MKTAIEFYNTEYKKVCHNHSDYMDFAEAYADYIAKKVKAFEKLPKEETKGTCNG